MVKAGVRSSSNILFLTILLYSCANSTQIDRIIELEEENRIALMTIDSLMQIDAFRFNDILLNETGTPNDTILILEYEALLIDIQSEFWKNLVSNRISIINARPARQNASRRLFGTWEWVQTDGGWGFISTPETEGRNRKIIINEDYTIRYFVNGIETRLDSFYISTVNEFPLTNRYHTIFNKINQKSAEAFEIRGNGNDIRLIFYTPWFWGMDFPSDEFRKITNE